MRVHVHRQGYLHCSIEGCHRDSILVPFCALASMSLTIIFIVVFLLDLSASRASSEFDRVQLLLSFPDFVILILSNSVRNKWSSPIILITHCSFPGSQEAIIYFFSRSLEHSALYRGSSYCSRSFAVLTPPSALLETSSTSSLHLASQEVSFIFCPSSVCLPPDSAYK